MIFSVLLVKLQKTAKFYLKKRADNKLTKISFVYNMLISRFQGHAFTKKVNSSMTFQPRFQRNKAERNVLSLYQQFVRRETDELYKCIHFLRERTMLHAASHARTQQLFKRNSKSLVFKSEQTDRQICRLPSDRL